MHWRYANIDFEIQFIPRTIHSIVGNDTTYCLLYQNVALLAHTYFHYVFIIEVILCRSYLRHYNRESIESIL